MKFRSMHAKKLFIFYAIFSITFVWNCKSDSGSNAGENSGSSIQVNLSRSVILFIGEGMGEAQRNAASLSLGDTLVMDDMPTYGFSRTNSANSDITDSAAAATAIATGVKTNNDINQILLKRFISMVFRSNGGHFQLVKEYSTWSDKCNPNPIIGVGRIFYFFDLQSWICRNDF